MPSRSFVRVGSAAILTLALAVPVGSAVAQDGATITFLTPPWGVPPDQDALAAFEAESGISVDVIDAGQMETLFTNVAVASAAGEPAADVIFLTEEAPSNIVATGNVEDLTGLIEAAGTDLGEFDQVDFWQVDGATYGIPVYSQLVMLDYNAAKVADAGFEAPTTWQELSDIAYAMQESGADANPVAMGSIDWSWYLMALSMGDEMFDADLNPVFADEGSMAREAMAMLLGWFSDEIISPGIIGQSQHTAFWEGTGTFHQGWQGSIGVANNPERSAQAPDVEYLLLPDEHFTWSFPAAVGIGTGSARTQRPPTSSSSGTPARRTRPPSTTPRACTRRVRMSPLSSTRLAPSPATTSSSSRRSTSTSCPAPRCGGDRSRPMSAPLSRKLPPPEPIRMRSSTTSPRSGTT